MLNKKGQTEDNIEMVLCIIGIVIGVVVLTIAKADFESSAAGVKQSVVLERNEIQSVDTQLMGTDLLNVLRLQVSQEYTFGELVAHLPENYPEVQDTSLAGLVQGPGEMTCTTELYNELNNYLEPVYGDDWFITVISSSEVTIFHCTPKYAVLPGSEYFWQAYLPTTNPDEQVLVILQVFQ